MSSAPTLKSIAQRVGTTANTVSLALRDSPLVAQATKARIQAAAREMGYVQNAIAGSLRSGRTNTIAVVMGDIANPLFAAKTKALERVLREEGYQIIIFNSDEDVYKRQVISRSCITPVFSSRRSASVDLPWSMWAIMQKLRILPWSNADTFVPPSRKWACAFSFHDNASAAKMQARRREGGKKARFYRSYNHAPLLPASGGARRGAEEKARAVFQQDCLIF